MPIVNAETTSYEDEHGLVICDKKNASAWIRSDVTVDVRR